MSTDRELLEDAAKAAGLRLTRWDEGGQAFRALSDVTSMFFLWNPLTDDGDAFRLAVALRLHVGYSGGNQYFAGPSDSDKNCMRESGERNGVQDPAAATRRAIVRAAAALAPA